MGPIKIILYLFGVAFCGDQITSALNIHFEPKEEGFFIKQISRQNPQSNIEINSITRSPLSVNRFTVLRNTQPVSIRAVYGPFSTKQTLPAHYIVADPIPINSSGPSIEIQDIAVHQLDISAHIVRHEIPRDSPVLRVLFHAGTGPASRPEMFFAQDAKKLCIILHATMGNHTLKQACSLNGEDGVCLSQITFPSQWWPPVPLGRFGKVPKTPQRVVQLSYSLVEPQMKQTDDCQSKFYIQPATGFGSVTLVPAKTAYKEVQLAEAVSVLVPQSQVYPLSRMHVPVLVEKQRMSQVIAMAIRCRVKSGLRIVNITTRELNNWNISSSINGKQTNGTVTFLRTEPPNEEDFQQELIEVFTMLVEMSEEPGTENASMMWTAKFEPYIEYIESFPSENHKHMIHLSIMKDDIQAIVPISKNWEIINTSILTSRQVSQAMKIFIISQAGKVGDITFQASCQSLDDSILKVSSSCSSVYVDGSELRSSINASVLVTYGSHKGIAQFTVWTPELPLDIQVPDVRLSQVKQWRVPITYKSNKLRRMKRSSKKSWSQTKNLHYHYNKGSEKASCKPRFQQTSVDVYARFVANDYTSGRVMYFINRRTWLQITDLVLPLLRVSDPRIASLNGRILHGKTMGRTEVQVLSPITGRVIGAKEIRVTNDKVTLEKLDVQVISGLQLTITPDSTITNGYMAQINVTKKLTAQYQEGLLDMELKFSDGSRIPLKEVSDREYHLAVDSCDAEVVAFAPMIVSHHPRVIAVGESSGCLVHVSLILPEECRSNRYKMSDSLKLASADVSVEVNFNVNDTSNKQDILQNDGISGASRNNKEDAGLQNILRGNGKSERNGHLPYNGYSRNHHHSQNDKLSSIDITMYVMLAAFCFAIVVFVVSCVVYASKYKTAEYKNSDVKTVAVETTNFLSIKNFYKSRAPEANVHDWVWLGRSRVEYNQDRTSRPQSYSNEMRITSNPLSANYYQPEDALQSNVQEEICEVSSFRNFKRNSRNRELVCSIEESNPEANADDEWNKPVPPPPLPPHAVALNTTEDIEEYRPPVPPHQNINSNGTDYSYVAERNDQKRKSNFRDSKKFEDVIMPKIDVFEFDDEPTSSKVESVDNLHKQSVAQKLEKHDAQFVKYTPDLPKELKVRKPEIKTANIIDTPMYNTKKGLTTSEQSSKEQLPNLDDLQLQMDFDQIMQYFNNLKESNA